jgi:hypothetical protein
MWSARRNCIPFALAAFAILAVTGCRPAEPPPQKGPGLSQGGEPADSRPASALGEAANRVPPRGNSETTGGPILEPPTPATRGGAEAMADPADRGARVDTTIAEQPDRGAAEVLQPRPPVVVKLPPPEGATRLAPDFDVWVNPGEKIVIVDGLISLREGMLEMFACLPKTKEHESIVSANTKAFIVHAALLSVGAEPGQPVQFRPEYRPPTGTEIEISVEWFDLDGKKHSARAQDWIKNVNTGAAMVHPFVFAGSGFWTNPETGEQRYLAEGGDFICVSNFGTAMIDIPVPSSEVDEELMFLAFTERIPPLGAPVRMILRPKLKQEGDGRRVGGAPTRTDERRALEGGRDGASGDR